MDANPLIREVHDELEAAGVRCDGEAFEDDVVHVERVTFRSRAGEPCEVLYAFAWDEDGDKVGVSHASTIRMGETTLRYVGTPTEIETEL